MNQTKIEWCDETWNPVSGCSKVSQGCKNCYAERVFPRPYPGRAFTDVRCHEDRLDQPLRMRKPRRIFVNSMSDLFHEDVPDEFIDRVFAIMSACDRHTFLILTKRPERMRQWFATRTPDEDFGTPLKASDPVGTDPEEITRWKIQGLADELRDNCGLDWPLRNVWLGVSVEDQATADERIPLLLQTPAAVRFVSYEPALGPIDFTRWLPCPRGGPNTCGNSGPTCCQCDGDRTTNEGLDWAIVGGESGPGARPFDVQWARSVIAQCKAASVPVFMKQLGSVFARESAPDSAWLRTRIKTDRKGGDPSEWPEGLRVREFPDRAITPPPCS